ILPMLQAQKIPLPLPTRIILTASNFIRADWIVALIGLNVVVFLAFAVRGTTRGKYVIDGLQLKIPVIGSVIRDVNMARIVTYLGLFYRTGVELVLSLELVERIIANSVVAHAVHEAREKVMQGVTMASAFGDSPLFPPVVLRSIALGEA